MTLIDNKHLGMLKQLGFKCSKHKCFVFFNRTDGDELFNIIDWLGNEYNVYVFADIDHVKDVYGNVMAASYEATVDFIKNGDFTRDVVDGRYNTISKALLYGVYYALERLTEK